MLLLRFALEGKAESAIGTLRVHTWWWHQSNPINSKLETDSASNHFARGTQKSQGKGVDVGGSTHPKWLDDARVAN